MINAGLLGWLRLLPLGEIVSMNWTAAIVFLGLFAQFYGVVMGLTQRNPKTLLAYSSISQMGIMTMLIGFGFYLPEYWSTILVGITFFALHHGLNKGALFLGVGMLGSTNKLQRNAIWLGLFIPTLALAAFPYSSGMVAKYLVKSSAAFFIAPWSSIFSVLLFIGTVNTALLMIRLLYLVRPASAPFGVSASFSLLWPWTLPLVSILSLPFSLESSVKVMQQLNALPFLYPLFFGILISIFIIKTKKFQNIQPIPAGDILLYYEKVLHFLIQSGKKLNIVLLYYKYFTAVIYKLTRIFWYNITLLLK